ncbi:hypothetical protein PAE9249_05126 [Paenibacillus sp. CECT 9249]|uniref:hypothetical protein n=1 Tax=Paenibacillus sp. CECT 9249 TaxID=2845385 RepID=UPI001E468B4D|nr:hypothetical protein [Paenibacillus sp. CECT 9249]CAH0122554.1 hypothetical protein PAE9249_05126 [Paenibacillus sp. CECT 9249]
MPMPATTGQLRDRIQDMKIGDYIVFHYNQATNTVSTGTGGFEECPVTGSLYSGNGNPPSSFWYMIKVDRGLLISDRVSLVNISWDTLNSWKWIEGKTISVDRKEGQYRSLSGGVGHVTLEGNMSLVDTQLGGYPVNNEYDTFIVKGKVKPNDDSVFHHVNVGTLCQETPAIGVQYIGSDGKPIIAINTHRVRRGYEGKGEMFRISPSNYSNVSYGFRPVFEYKEV